jgi:hypothetical protein
MRIVKVLRRAPIQLSSEDFDLKPFCVKREEILRLIRTELKADSPEGQLGGDESDARDALEQVQDRDPDQDK